jgi:hypothetical protein
MVEDDDIVDGRTVFEDTAKAFPPHVETENLVHNRNIHVAKQ